MIVMQDECAVDCSRLGKMYYTSNPNLIPKPNPSTLNLTLKLSPKLNP